MDEKRKVVVVAPATPAGNRLVHVVATMSSNWECKHVLPSEIETKGELLSSAGAIIVATDREDEERVASSLPADRPVISCSDEPPQSLKAMSWLRRPSVAALRTLLREAFANESDSPILAYRDAKTRFEEDYYSRLLRASRGNISLAAKLAQKTRKEVYEALRRLGLEADEYRDDELA